MSTVERSTGHGHSPFAVDHQRATDQRSRSPAQSSIPPERRPLWRRWWFIAIAVLAVFVALSVLGAVVGDDDEIRQLFNESDAAFNEGRWDDTVAAMTSVIELEPDDPSVLAHAHTNRGIALARLDRNEEALADATAAIDLQPFDNNLLARAHNLRSNTLHDFGRFYEAIDEATTAIELEPSDDRVLALAHMNRAAAFLSSLQVEGAVSDLETILEILPADDPIAQDALEGLNWVRDARGGR